MDIVDSCFTMIMGCSLVAMHWQHHFNHMVGSTMISTGCSCQISRLMYADTYCSNMAKSGMNQRHCSTSCRAFGYKRNNECVHIWDLMMPRRIEGWKISEGTGGEIEQKKDKPVCRKCSGNLIWKIVTLWLEI